MPDDLDRLLNFLQECPQPAPFSDQELREAQQRKPFAWLLLLARAALCWGASRMDIRSAKSMVWVDIGPIANIDAMRPELEACFGGRRGKTEVELLHQALQAVGDSGLELSFVGRNESQRLVLQPCTQEASPLPSGPALQIRMTPQSPMLETLASDLKLRLRFSPLAVYLQGQLLNQPILHFSEFFPQAVKDDQEPALRRTFCERIWLNRASQESQLLVADPLLLTTHRILYGGTLYESQGGSINLQEWCEPSGDGFLGVTSPARKLAWKKSQSLNFPSFQVSVGGMFSAPKLTRPVSVGAILRWGREQRGKGLLFIVHQGVLLNPLDLGPHFPGCWAFVGASGLGVEPAQHAALSDQASSALIDWTRNQFVEMGQTLANCVSLTSPEALGVRLNFLNETRAAAARFEAWSAQEWGDPCQDE